MGNSDLEDVLARQLEIANIHDYSRQYKLPELPKRRFRFDFAFPEARVLIEVQGSTWVANTGHTSGAGIERDTEKLCLATLNGYKVLCVTRKQIESGQAIIWIAQVLKVG